MIPDPGLGVSVAFASDEDGRSIEFVEPLGPRSPIDAILESGGGPYHLCFSVSDLSAAIVAARAAGAIVASGPAPAAAFGGKRVAFVYLGANNLVELLEA